MSDKKYIAVYPLNDAQKFLLNMPTRPTYEQLAADNASLRAQLEAAVEPAADKHRLRCHVCGRESVEDRMEIEKHCDDPNCTRGWMREFNGNEVPAADAGQAVAWKCRDCDWIGTSNNCANSGGHEVFPYTHPARHDAGAADATTNQLLISDKLVVRADEDVVRDALRTAGDELLRAKGTISCCGQHDPAYITHINLAIKKIDAAIATAAPAGEARTASSPSRGVAK